MPLEPSSFPEEVQMAFFMHGYISDRWDGMNGVYLGKNWIEAEYLFKIYGIQEPREILYFMKIYDGLIAEKRFEAAERERKKAERKSDAGKNYTHNVKG